MKKGSQVLTVVHFLFSLQIIIYHLIGWCVKSSFGNDTLFDSYFLLATGKWKRRAGNGLKQSNFNSGRLVSFYAFQKIYLTFSHKLFFNNAALSIEIGYFNFNHVKHDVKYACLDELLKWTLIHAYPFIVRCNLGTLIFLT